MKNSMITMLTALTLVLSTYIYAAEDHKHDHPQDETDNYKQHHAEGDHEQDDDHVDHEETSTEDHDEDYDHNATKQKTRGDK